MDNLYYLEHKIKEAREREIQKHEMQTPKRNLFGFLSRKGNGGK